MTRTQKEYIGMAIVAIIAFSMIAYGLIGCAGLSWQQSMTPRQNYYTALKVWDDQFSLYLTAYDGAGPETKAKWKSTIDPIVKAANKAIHIWGASQGTIDEAAKYQLWIDAQRQALALLLQAGIIKVEEVK